MEMVVLLAVLGVAAAMAVPLFGSSDMLRLSWAATQLESDIIYAKAQSLIHAADPRVVVFDRDLNRYHLAAGSTRDVPLTHPVMRRPYIVPFGGAGYTQLEGVSIESYDLGGDDALGFGAYGQLDQDTDAVITLAAGEGRAVLIVSPGSGEVEIWE